MRTAYLLAAIGIIGGTASAGNVVVTGEPAPTAVVSYADINLDSVQGVDQIHHRITAAANDLCLTTNVESVGLRTARMACFHSARDAGYAQLDRIVLDHRNGVATA